jgi:hypothetical protein
MRTSNSRHKRDSVRRVVVIVRAIFTDLSTRRREDEKKILSKLLGSKTRQRMADQLTGHERAVGRGEHWLTAVLCAARVTTLRQSLALCHICVFGSLLFACMVPCYSLSCTAKRTNTRKQVIRPLLNHKLRNQITYWRQATAVESVRRVCNRAM